MFIGLMFVNKYIFFLQGFVSFTPLAFDVKHLASDDTSLIELATRITVLKSFKDLHSLYLQPVQGMY